LGIGIVSILLTGLGMSAGFAQGGELTTDQIDLINRAVAARNSLDEHASYVETAKGQSRYEISVQETDGLTPLSSVQVWSRESTVVQVEDVVNIQALISLAVKRSEQGEKDVTYTVDAEARLVDDTLYVNATYAKPDSAALPAPLPEGWQVVDDLNSHAVYNDLQLDDLKQTPELFDAPDVIIAAASDVTLSPEQLDDGTVVDAITITIDAEGMASVLREYKAENSEDAEIYLAMADALDESSSWEIVVLLDDTDTPLVFRTTSLVRAFGVPASALGQAGSNMRFNIFLDTTREHVYSRFDDDGLSPVPQPSLEG
jgi:hypothetical protein